LYLENLPAPVEMEIYTPIGERMMGIRLTQTKISVDISSLSRGIYFVRIISPDLGEVIVRKLLIN
jgi:hypothetical protein